MILHSIFLRNGCALPDRVDPPRGLFCDHWAQVDKVGAADFDLLIRRAGWHFVCVQGSCSRRGYGSTEEKATHRALASALRGNNKRFNAAEFDLVRITRFPSFYVAKVTMEAHQVQHNTSLDITDEDHLDRLTAR